MELHTFTCSSATCMVWFWMGCGLLLGCGSGVGHPCPKQLEFYFSVGIIWRGWKLISWFSRFVIILVFIHKFEWNRKKARLYLKEVMSKRSNLKKATNLYFLCVPIDLSNNPCIVLYSWTGVYPSLFRQGKPLKTMSKHVYIKKTSHCINACK